ncbi:copper homeostasis protein CutC [Paenibacillus sp. ACRRX]|uniref:copper homeostasis protein CutC n=1 Tax=Paenibacillus sp. ACRRX TaxID=2918206 RepID=UPI001EF54481|nr:copper homeostasis protein CutC [Paenibacillus sp. ACRRX]MCG7409745.1 copper homeostasis protein CutC [Paenibacillus sp. ACRRX]
MKPYQSRIHLEVIATTLSDVRAAQDSGADRIELITAIAEGGLTPSLALVEQAVQLSTIPVRVMVRPHARSFVYDADDCETILKDIEHIRAVGAEAIVFGALTEIGQIDEHLLKQVIAAAGAMKLTFHRAIDEASDIMEALAVIKRHPSITDILTSGGAPTAPEGIHMIEQMHFESIETGLHIMAGAGLTLDNIAVFTANTKITHVHVGSTVRQAGKALMPLDPARVKMMRTELDRVIS